MLSTKLNPFLLLPTLLFIFSTFLSLSHKAPQVHGLRTYENDHDVGSRGIRRHIREATKAETEHNSSLILAAERTHRKDPLDGFSYYKGGWNISERHYFSSVGFTAASLFVLAAAWFLGFGAFMLVIGLCHCCRQHQPSGYSRIAFALSLVFLYLFTVASIVGCVALYVGQGKFHNDTTDTLDYVVRQADFVARSLGNVSYYLGAAKDVRIAQIFLPSNIQQSIESVEKKINASSTLLEHETKDNSDDIHWVLDSVRLTLVIIAAVMLLLVFLGLLFSVLGLRRLVDILKVMGWILVTATFILGGIFLLLHNAVADTCIAIDECVQNLTVNSTLEESAVGFWTHMIITLYNVIADTCVAMDEWVQNPTANSALDDILPCVDNATAQQSLYESKDVTFQLVEVVNQFINNISNLNTDTVPPDQAASLIFFNQSGPLVPILCNPFHSDKTDRKCSDGEVNFDNAEQEWKKYVCQTSEAGICTTVGRLTPPYYDQLTAISSLGSVLYNYGPFLIELLDCTFVRKIFRNICVEHCQGLRRNSRLIVIGLVLLSFGVMLSVIFWLLFARERKYRGYTKQFEHKSPHDR